MKYRLLTKLSFGIFAFFLLTAHWPVKSEVATEIEKKEDTLTIRFKVTPIEGHKPTNETDWHLVVRDAENLDLKLNEKGVWETKEYDKNLPGFVFVSKTKAGQSSGKLDFEIRAFICTEDETRCFPQQHSGNIKW